jgi:solute carrier family 25 carnitine/acylcarnitine transporter 20/29
MVGPFFKGGVCATTAWLFAFPFEAAKSVIQADTTGMYKKMPNATWRIMRKLYHERGVVHGLYRGFGPGAGRSFVANGISMLVFSKFQEFLRQEEE